MREGKTQRKRERERERTSGSATSPLFAQRSTTSGRTRASTSRSLPPSSPRVRLPGSTSSSRSLPSTTAAPSPRPTRRRFVDPPPSSCSPAPALPPPPPVFSPPSGHSCNASACDLALCSVNTRTSSVFASSSWSDPSFSSCGKYASSCSCGDMSCRKSTTCSSSFIPQLHGPTAPHSPPARERRRVRNARRRPTAGGRTARLHRLADDRENDSPARSELPEAAAGCVACRSAPGARRTHPRLRPATRRRKLTAGCTGACGTPDAVRHRRRTTTTAQRHQTHRANRLNWLN